MNRAGRRDRRALAVLGGAVAALCLPVAGAAAQPPKPVRPEVCLDCHEAPEGRVVHAPVAQKACLRCHDPHAAEHASLLHGSDLELCTECHEGVGALAREATHPHGALRGERACLQCHAGHAGQQASLLREPLPELCVACHASIAPRLAGASSHVPAAQGDCSLCHEPHGASRRALLLEERPTMCATCHDAAALGGSHHGFDLRGTDCTSCHDPHGSASDPLMRERVHAPFAEGACDLCHGKPETPRELPRTIVELCRECHDEKGSGSAAEHWLGQGVACTSCHSPHAGLEPAMVRSHARALCLECHVAIREQLGKGFSVHPIAADEGRCTACHRLHDAPSSPLLQAAPERVCAGCHEQHARFAHPMGPNVPDPRDSSRTVDCLSCHDPHASGERMLLRASPERELCVGCHRELR